MQTRLGEPSVESEPTGADLAEKPSFRQAASRAGNEILGWNGILVCHHYDADGLSSGGLVANVLSRAKKRFACLSLKKIDEASLALAAKAAEESGFGAMVFSDLGSGQLSLIERHVAGSFKTAVIDHHVPQTPGEGLVHVNCELHGYSGGTDACSASTAFCAFSDCEWTDSFGNTRDNWDLAHLAIVGSVGDMQDDGGLVSLNLEILEAAASRGLVERRKDLRMFGRVSRNLVSFLSYATEPLLPGLTGNDKACAAFLEDHGIAFRDGERWLHYNELDGNDRRKLVSALVNHCLERGLDSKVIEGMVGDVYQFPRERPNTELFDAYEYSTLLNACGRHGHEPLGIRVCMGEPGAFDESRGVLATHRMMISKGISYAVRHCNDLGAFYLVDARGKVEDTVIGTVIGGFFNSGSLYRDKPIIGFSLDEKGATKISGRASKELVARGVNLNEVMRTCAAAAGGLGGGHNIAAGATIAPGAEAEFLRMAKELLEKQSAASGG